MATGLLKQPQWGSGARAHKQIQRCSACLCCALVSCGGYGQEGMSQDYYSHANANSGEKNKAQRKNHFIWMKVPKISI